MKTKMTAVAMVAVMIIAAFAVVGMADSGAADNSDATNKKEKDILGTWNNPYVLNKDGSVKSNLEFNRSAFSDNAVIKFNYKWKDATHDSHGTFSDETEFTPNTASTITDSSNTSRFEINVTPQTTPSEPGVYSVSLKGLSANPINTSSVIAITVSITDKVLILKVDNKGLPIRDNKGNLTYIETNLPTQTYTFNAYLNVVDATKENIKLDGVGVDDTKIKIDFNFEQNYLIGANVYIGEEKAALPYNYYAVNLPDGISMTVAGKIGGRLSSNLQTGDGKFTVYAVSATGHVVSQEMSYSIGNKADRGFKITEGTDNNEQFATKRVGDKVNLVITPNSGHTLSNVMVKYDGISADATKSATSETYTASFKCEGTGIIKVSVSAQVDESNVTMTKIFTVYVVGEIFNTDLDPEVTN